MFYNSYKTLLAKSNMLENIHETKLLQLISVCRVCDILTG